MATRHLETNRFEEYVAEYVTELYGEKEGKKVLSDAKNKSIRLLEHLYPRMTEAREFKSMDTARRIKTKLELLGTDIVCSDEEFDFVKEDRVEDQYFSYSRGIKLLKPFFDCVKYVGYLDLHFLVEAVLVFNKVVFESGERSIFSKYRGFGTFLSKKNVYVKEVVQDGKVLEFEIALLKFRLHSELVKGMIWNEAKSDLSWEVKLKKFKTWDEVQSFSEKMVNSVK